MEAENTSVTTRNPNRFLHKKRAPFLPKQKPKSHKKHNSDKKNQNIDFDLIRDNFRHFLHINFEDPFFDKELGNLCK